MNEPVDQGADVKIDGCFSVHGRGLIDSSPILGDVGTDSRKVPIPVARPRFESPRDVSHSAESVGDIVRVLQDSYHTDIVGTRSGVMEVAFESNVSVTE